MSDRLLVRRDTYFDSVTLMKASQQVAALPRVSEAAAVAATAVNLGFLSDLGFDPAESDLSPDDLVIAIRAEDDDAVDEALAALEDALRTRRQPSGDGAPPAAAKSVAAAARRDPELNLAFVSVPGQHAAYEVASALEAGLHVFCFSDGLPLDIEAVLKRRAVDRGLLLMGADCGTAIIDGVALGFANAVGRGPVGVVAASGTGMQEVTCLLDAAGVGISQAVGVGGRDLKTEIGGLMTLRGLELLGADGETEAIVVLSKPPDAEIAEQVGKAAAETGKPTVLGFLGMTDVPDLPSNVRFAGSLEEAAARAAELQGAQLVADEVDVEVGASPGHVRGMFTGGSLCYEAMSVVADAGGQVLSNIPLRPEWQLDEPFLGDGHVFLDFGEDEFTVGRPHPMIDPTLRNERLERELADSDVGVVLLDVVLGYGAHHDPAEGLRRIIERGLRQRGSSLSVIASVCGAGGDPQGVDDQASALREAGATVTRSAAHAARLAVRAAGIAGGEQ